MNFSIQQITCLILQNCTMFAKNEYLFLIQDFWIIIVQMQDLDQQVKKITVQNQILQGNQMLDQELELQAYNRLGIQAKDKAQQQIAQSNLQTIQPILQRKEQQTQCQLLLEMNQVRQMLQIKYPHLNQYKVVKSLYKKICKNTKENLKPVQQLLQPKPSLETEKMDFQNTKFLKQAAKVYVQHGYGLQIARRYLQDEIQPNKYNNSITRLVRECWKAIQVRMHALRHKPALKTSQFNMIKTPLVNARTWMDSEAIKTYHSYIYFSLGMDERPSDEKTIQLYQKVLKTMKKSKYKDNSKHVKLDKYSNNSAQEGREDEGISKIKMMIKEALNKERR